MKTIYLHIGLHKTGTTSIQKMLFGHPELLRASAYVYPEIGIPGGSFGHHNLAWELAGDARYNRRAGGWRQLETRMQRESAARVILSSEEFCVLDAGQVREISERLRGMPVAVVVFLRRQDQYLRAMYGEALKRGLSKTFEECLGTELDMADYSRILGRWSQAFGADNIRVGIMDAAGRARPERLLNSFLYKVGWEVSLTEFDSLTVENPGEPEKVLTALRFANGFFRQDKHLAGNRVTPLYERYFSTPHGIVPRLIMRLPDRLVAPRILSPAAAQQVADHFRAANERVARKYLGSREVLAEWY